LPFRSSSVEAAPRAAAEDAAFPSRESLPDTPVTPPPEDAAVPAVLPLPTEDNPPVSDVPDPVQATWRLRLAERRLQSVFDELEAASLREASSQELRRREQAYEDEMCAYEIAYTACQVVQQVPAIALVAIGHQFVLRVGQTGLLPGVVVGHAEGERMVCHAIGLARHLPALVRSLQVLGFAITGSRKTLSRGIPA